MAMPGDVAESILFSGQQPLRAEHDEIEARAVAAIACDVMADHLESLVTMKMRHIPAGSGAEGAPGRSRLPRRRSGGHTGAIRENRRRLSPECAVPTAFS